VLLLVLGEVDLGQLVVVGLHLRHRRGRERRVAHEAQSKISQGGEDEPPGHYAREHDPAQLLDVKEVKVVDGKGRARGKRAHLVALIAVRIGCVEIGDRPRRRELVVAARVSRIKQLVGRVAHERVRCSINTKRKQ
jgi:hypothetical protein